jgi:hypothetical protein
MVLIVNKFNKPKLGFACISTNDHGINPIHRWLVCATKTKVEPCMRYANLKSVCPLKLLMKRHHEFQQSVVKQICKSSLGLWVCMINHCFTEGCKFCMKFS